jgi:hypothetical protein
MKMHKSQKSTEQQEFRDTEAKLSTQSTVSRRSSCTFPMLTRTKSHSGDVEEGQERRGVLRKVKKGVVRAATVLGLIILVIL